MSHLEVKNLEVQLRKEILNNDDKAKRIKELEISNKGLVQCCEDRKEVFDNLRGIHQTLVDTVKKVVTQQADDLCWMDVYVELGNALVLAIHGRLHKSHRVTAENCKRYCTSLKTGTNYEPMSDDSFHAWLMRQNEAKAVKIAEMEKEIERLRGIVNGIPHAIESGKRQVVEEMAVTSVNTIGDSCAKGCHLARQKHRS